MIDAVAVKYAILCAISRCPSIMPWQVARHRPDTRSEHDQLSISPHASRLESAAGKRRYHPLLQPLDNAAGKAPKAEAEETRPKGYSRARQDAARLG
jgi:hypothetical protein